QPRLPAAHRVEDRARELARAALDEAQVPGEGAVRLEAAGRGALADHELRQPLRVEATSLHRDARLLLEIASASACGLVTGRRAPHAELRRPLEGCARDRELLPRPLGGAVDRLACDQQVHDLARALEDAVDPHVAQVL